MRRILVCFGVMIGLSAAVVLAVQSRPGPAKQASAAEPLAPDEPKAQASAHSSADEEAIRANIAKFVKAYNAGDAKAVAALFTVDGQIEDKDGDKTDGRAAIEEDFAEMFAGAPHKRIEVFVDSIRFIGKELAVQLSLLIDEMLARRHGGRGTRVGVSKRGRR